MVGAPAARVPPALRRRLFGDLRGPYPRHDTPPHYIQFVQPKYAIPGTEARTKHQKHSRATLVKQVAVSSRVTCQNDVTFTNDCVHNLTVFLKYYIMKEDKFWTMFREGECGSVYLVGGMEWFFRLCNGIVLMIASRPVRARRTNAW